MSNFVPETVFLRGVLFHYFNMKLKNIEKLSRKTIEDEELQALVDEDCLPNTRKARKSFWSHSKRLKANNFSDIWTELRERYKKEVALDCDWVKSTA